MRICFAGTPEFAATALARLIEAAPVRGWTVPLVLSQPDRPAGRGLRLTPSPVRQLALSHGLETFTPVTLSVKKGGAEAEAAQARLRAAAPDVLVVAAYGLILPQAVLDLPAGLPQRDGTRLTALNIHGSLLPRWRGAAPVARAIEAGDAVTGITIMQMEAGLDTGPMLLDAPLPIAPTHTAATLTAALADLGADLIVRALDAAAAGTLRARRQPDEGVTYAHKLAKHECWLDPARDADTLARQVRAFDPFPVAALRIGGEVVRLWQAQAEPEQIGDSATPAGTVLAADGDGLLLRAGRGRLRVTQLQRAGGKRLPAREFFAGGAIAAGARVDPPPPGEAA
jgi:methionyl-tRNA formyltransferase